MEKKIVINLEKIAKYIKKNLMNFYILLFFIIITLLMTYPLVFNIDSSFPAAGDTYEYAWDFWYIKQVLFQGASPFFSNYIFYPNGVSLAFHDTTMFNSLLSIPFQLIFNLTTVYNLLFLFSFILSGFGAYLLVFYLT